MTKTIHFLSGLPRTGSTLLGALLSQNPLITATATSPCLPLLIATTNTLHVLNNQHTFDHDRVRDDVSRAIIESMYRKIETPIVFDKNRGWPEQVPAIKRFITPHPKIVATVRPVSEILASYISLCERTPQNFIDDHLRQCGKQVTHSNRACLAWEHYLYPMWGLLSESLDKYHEHILLVSYDDLVFDTHSVLAQIYNFCDMPCFRHQLNDITVASPETKDAEWGAVGLHHVRREIDKQSEPPESYLSAEEIEHYRQFDIEANLCHARL